MGRTYHKLSVGRESFEIDTRLVPGPLLLGCALNVGQVECLQTESHLSTYCAVALLCRYKNLKPIGDGSYGFVCSADDEVSLHGDPGPPTWSGDAMMYIAAAVVVSVANTW